MNQESLENQQQSQQQNLGDVNLGDDNNFNMVQGNNNVITLNRTKIIQISVDEIKTRELKEASPYKGLKRFEEVDKDRFFGRDQFLTGLVNELEQTNLLLLLGASGSGKSSVIRAGLIPWLSQKWGSSRFTNLTFTPNQDPFNSLYHRLHEHYSQAEAEFILEGKADSLTQVVNTVIPSEDFCFIFIDQFEELFTIAQADKRDRFIDNLEQLSTALTNTGNPSVKIVATMRADFLDQLSPYSALIEATDKHRPMIAEMQRDELRLAIEQPAAHHGVVFETGLVEEIIKDVQGQAGYLPLLQYTLDLLWETEKETGSLQDRTLNISTYRRLGGVRGALQKHVDRIYSNLSEQEQLAVQRIFLKLVEIGGDEESETQWKPIRRRANRSEFSDELEQKSLTRLINQNLLVSNRPDQSQESIIEIAHEILLTSWTTLSAWILENRQAIALRNRLNDDVARWQAKKAEDELWSGSKLEQVLELRNDPTFSQVLGGFSPAANQFIDASLEKRDRLLREEKRRIIWQATLVSTFLAIITGLGGFLWQKQQQYQFTLNFQAAKDNAVTPAIADNLRRKLPNFLNEVDKLAADAGKVDEALNNYRQVRIAINNVQKAIAEKKKEFPNHLNYESTFQGILNRAETSQVKVILKERIPTLQAELKIGKLGNRKGRKKIQTATDFEKQFTPGAIQTTYTILIQGSGLKADLNNNGQLDTPEETDMIPCEILKAIEQLWRDSTSKQCGWYGSENITEERSPLYHAPNCQQLNGETLTGKIFNAPYTPVIKRLEYCQLIPQQLN
ncbi:MAG TPA: ATP-binding protein [Coleofasciculaceae cyanobacterium]